MSTKYSSFWSSEQLKRRFLRRISSPPINQRGQAMPLGIAFILVGMVGAFVLFNTGQVAVNKQRLSDASDSAAYSGMVWQARALNFQAYTNRAMIANDVTIGQAVSLTSWSTYATIGSENVAAATAAIPIVGAFTNALATIFGTTSRFIKPISTAMVTAVGAINTVIGTAQQTMFVSSFIATPDIVDKVAKASDDDFEALSGYALAGMALNLQGWQSFTEKYEQTDIDAMRERTDLIGESRDSFSTDRRWKFFDKFWFFVTPFIQHRFYYDGQTRLMMSTDDAGTPNWEWVAKDATSLHNKIYYFRRFKWRSRTEQAPIGWASAYANSNGGGASQTIDANRQTGPCKGYATYNDDGESDACSDFLDNNENAEYLADIGMRSARGTDSGPIGLSGYRGVTAFRSLSQTVLEQERDSGDPVLRLRTEISMDMDKSESNNDWVHDSEPFATELASAGTKLSSISIAEVYYRHPKGYRTSNSDIALQRANGYNPYWDVRLAPVELEERLAALALREGFVTGGGGSATPGSNQLASYGGGDDLIDFELGGNVTDASGAIGTLASAMEIDQQAANLFESEVQGLLSNYPEYSDVEDIVDGFKGLADLTAIEDSLKTALKDALDEALQNLLGSTLNSIGISEGDVQNAVNIAESVTAEARAITDQIEHLREQVAIDFEEALISEVESYEAEIDFLTDELTPLLSELEALNQDINGRDHAGDGPISERNAVQDRIDALQDRIVDARVDLRDTITDAVIDSIDRNGGDLFSDGISSDFRDYIERDLHSMVEDYLSLTDEERIDNEPDSVLPWDNEEDDDDDFIDDYQENTYGDFED